ncbi:hypothetical protein F5146DRAFT_1228247 [Armillaria mellea]|nr:hypothetical protein F5146DRAFT_1228247 [Armillaria mellea]
MISQPSDQPYDPDFGWDYDIDDPTALREACRELRRLRKVAMLGCSQQVWLSFTVAFPHVFQESGIANARKLPLFATSSGTYNVVVTSVIQTFSDHRTFWSQVCVAEVRLGEEVKGKVVLKILQPSLLPIPQPKAEEPFDHCISPKHLPRMEDLVYGKLESLQGTVIPYYFGLKKLTMPNGEVAGVLFMEYIDGVTVAQWKRTYLKHENLYSDDEDEDEDEEDETESVMSEDLWSSSMERQFETVKVGPEGGSKLFYRVLDESKRIFPLALCGITEINSLGISHQDVRPDNMPVIIYPYVKVPQGVVFIDFARSLVNIPPEEVQERWGKTKRVINYTCGCCYYYRDEVTRWANEDGNLPLALYAWTLISRKPWFTHEYTSLCRVVYLQIHFEFRN